jgi:hypothetical protein
MDKKEKSAFGEPRDWGMALGGLISVAGLLRLISGVWTPDTIAEAGSGNLTAALITIVIGLAVMAASYLVLRKS